MAAVAKRFAASSNTTSCSSECSPSHAPTSARAVATVQGGFQERFSLKPATFARPHESPAAARCAAFERRRLSAETPSASRFMDSTAPAASVIARRFSVAGLRRAGARRAPGAGQKVEPPLGPRLSQRASTPAGSMSMAPASSRSLRTRSGSTRSLGATRSSCLKATAGSANGSPRCEKCWRRSRGWNTCVKTMNAGIATR
mmetsp:Transcript_21353/g.63819  ORF Transcript_21353/g.63819 Transcript_21353/m.63819 type:complete len:201 (-) Transcript_21353:1172-1774(-)